MRRLLFAWDDFECAPLAYGLRHPASASCLGRHSRLAGRCPNNSSLFPPLAAVVVVAGHIQRKDYFIFRNTGASADAPVFHFHRWGRNGKTAVAAPLSAKARHCGVTPSGSLRSPAPPRGRLMAMSETLPPPLKPSPTGERWRVAPDEGQHPLALHALSGAPAPALPGGEPRSKVRC